MSETKILAQGTKFMENKSIPNNNQKFQMGTERNWEFVDFPQYRVYSYWFGAHSQLSQCATFYVH